MSKNYAKRFTKEDLIKAGIKEITSDYKVVYNSGRTLEKEEDFDQLKQGYVVFPIYDLDENGNKIKVPVKRKSKNCKNLINTYYFKMKVIGLHRAIWAWFNGEVPYGMVVDHIDNKHETIYDNRFENLQLLTPAENLAKERALSDWQKKCDMSKSLEFYENRLKGYLEEYKKEKEEHSSSTKKAHDLRSHIAQYRARIRYWKAHEEEHAPLVKYKANNEKAEELASVVYRKRASDLKELKKTIDEAHEAYNKNKTMDNKYIWKLAIENWKNYLKIYPHKKIENIKNELLTEMDSEVNKCSRSDGLAQKEFN